MKDWQSLSLLKKIGVGLVIVILANLSPELMLFMDVGGIEMAFSFLVLYYKQFLIRLQSWFQEVQNFCFAVNQVIINSSLMKPKVFIAHSTYGLFAMWFTGAIVFSMGFMLPALFVSSMGV